jgi:hypothetical protein
MRVFVIFPKKRLNRSRIRDVLARSRADFAARHDLPAAHREPS